MASKSSGKERVKESMGEFTKSSTLKTFESGSRYPVEAGAEAWETPPGCGGVDLAEVFISVENTGSAQCIASALLLSQKGSDTQDMLTAVEQISTATSSSEGFPHPPVSHKTEKYRQHDGSVQMENTHFSARTISHAIAPQHSS